MANEAVVMRELILLAAAALAVLLLFRRLRLPATVGFIITGILIGPGSFGLVGDPEMVRVLAEFGVVLLLFTVGLEFSLTDLRRLGRAALVGGALQVALTVAVVGTLLALAGWHPAQAIFVGMMAAQTSTAVILKLLADRVELEAPHGRLAVGVSLFQDVTTVPFLLLLLPLGRWLQGRPLLMEELRAALPGALALIVGTGLVFWLARRAIPWLLARASRAGSREAFLFGIIIVVLGSALLASRAGGSLAIGAFLAGLLLAGSELRDRIAAEVLPWRDVLSSVFFVAIGMSFAPAAVLTNPLLVLASTAGLVVLKAVLALVALRIARVPRRLAVAAALTLAQIGEFSFVLAQAARPHGLMEGDVSQAFYAGAVFSLLLASFVQPRASRWALALDRALAGRPGSADEEEVEAADAAAAPGAAGATPPRPREGHVVIAGFGLNGRNLARVLRSVHLPHVVVDLNPDVPAAAHREGSPALAGDISHPLIQRRAGVPRAEVLVLALSDPAATTQACRVARASSSELFIVVRTRYVDEIDQLYKAGANQVIPEEFETSIEIFTAVMRELHVPNNVVQAQIALLRQERYSLLRGGQLPGTVLEQLPTILLERTTDTFLLLQESPAVGRTLGELGIGAEGEARLVAVVRGGRPQTDCGSDFRLRVGDTLVVTGTHAEVDHVFERLRPSPP